MRASRIRRRRAALIAATTLACIVSLTACATAQFTTTARPPQAVASSPAVATPVASPEQPTPTVTPPPLLLSPSAETTANTDAPVVTGAFVLGDSISLAVAPILSRLGYPVVGKVGQSASDTYLRDNLSTEMAQAAPAWIIVLGTNNRGDASDIAAIPRWLDLIGELRPDGVPVYWVTPYRPPSYVGGLSSYTLDAFNAALNEQAAERPWLGIIDYATAAAFHPEWFAADGQHLHPDADGQGVLAAMIAGADAVPLGTPAPVTSLGGEPLAQAPNQGTGEPTTFTNIPAPSSKPKASAEPSPAASQAAEPAASPAPAASDAPPTPAASTPPTSG